MSFGDWSIAGGHIGKTWKNTQSAHSNKTQKQISTKNKWEGPPTYHIWVQNPHRRDPDPSKNHHAEGSHREAPPGCDRTLAYANRLGLPHGVLWWSPLRRLHGDMRGIFLQTDHSITINRWERPPHSHTLHLSFTLHLFLVVVSLRCMTPSCSRN
jgi:hypothetical protein